MRPAFELYFRAKSNKLLQYGKSIEKKRKPAVQPCLHPSSEIISDNERKNTKNQRSSHETKQGSF